MHPSVNIIIREPGHVEYAAKLGLGVADRAMIASRRSWCEQMSRSQLAGDRRAVRTARVKIM